VAEGGVVKERRGHREVARPQATKSVLPISIEKRPVIEQGPPDVDIRLLEPGAGHTPAMLVLDSLGLSLYEDTGAGWKQTQTVAIQSSKPWPRDLRGFLSLSRDSYSAFLPGLVCTGALLPALSMQCKGAAPWPFYLRRTRSPGRFRFHTQLLQRPSGERQRIAEKTAALFYDDRCCRSRPCSVATCRHDGRTRLYNGDLEEMGSWSGWGSDMAAIESQCGSRRKSWSLNQEMCPPPIPFRHTRCWMEAHNLWRRCDLFRAGDGALTAGGNTVFAIAQD